MSDADSPRTESPVVRRRSSRLANKTPASVSSVPYVSTSTRKRRTKKDDRDSEQAQQPSDSDSSQPGQAASTEQKIQQQSQSRPNDISSDSDNEPSEHIDAAIAGVEKLQRVDARIAELEAEDVSFRTLLRDPEFRQGLIRELIRGVLLVIIFFIGHYFLQKLTGSSQKSPEDLYEEQVRMIKSKLGQPLH